MRRRSLFYAVEASTIDRGVDNPWLGWIESAVENRVGRFVNLSVCVSMLHVVVLWCVRRVLYLCEWSLSFILWELRLADSHSLKCIHHIPSELRWIIAHLLCRILIERIARIRVSEEEQEAE